MSSRSLEQHYTTQEVAARLGVHLNTVMNWIKSGRIQPVRYLGPRLIRIPASAVERFMEARTP